MPRPSSKKICDTAVTSRLPTVSDGLPTASEIGDFELKIGRGRDLNPGPHGPEPCRCRVLLCPTDSRVALANTKSTSLVSFGDPLEPSGAGKA